MNWFLNFLGLIGKLIGIGAQSGSTTATNTSNREIAEDTNQTNKEISDATNAANKEVAEQNLQFQRDKLEYDKALQQEIFNREDTSYQRTTADMYKAGLNPLSMNGTNGSGSVVSTTAPNNTMQFQNIPAQIGAAIQDAGIGQMISNDSFDLVKSIQAGKQLELDQIKTKSDQDLSSSQANLNNAKAAEIMENILPEKLFNEWFDSLDDEDKARYFSSVYRNREADTQNKGASTENIKAGTEKTKAETYGTDLDNQFKEITIHDRVEALRLNNSILKDNGAKIKVEIQNLRELMAQRGNQAKYVGAEAEARIQNLYQQYQKTAAEIDKIKEEARLVGVDADLKEETKLLESTRRNLDNLMEIVSPGRKVKQWFAY